MAKFKIKHFRFAALTGIFSKGWKLLQPIEPKSDRAYDVLDFKLKDAVGNYEMGDLHIDIDSDGVVHLWSNELSLELDV